MHRIHLVQCAVAAALVAFALPASARIANDCRPCTGKSHCPADQAYRDAVALFREQRLSAAYGRFMALALEGDPDAARISQFMHRYGPVLFGTHWDASTEELEDWAGLAKTDQGRPAPRYTPPVREAGYAGRGHIRSTGSKSPASSAADHCAMAGTR